jgi:hypothetical protein
MTRITGFRTVGTFALVGLFAACGSPDPAPAGNGTGVPAMATGDTAHPHDMAGMTMAGDHAAMQRHAQEADSMAVAMRAHVERMRASSAEQQHDRIGEHVAQVSRMLNMMDRQMREMDHGSGMDDAHMGEMMGMSADDHRRMMEEMRTIRTEAEQLQVASRAEVSRTMPAHLDRIERMLVMMEASAAHMRAH